MKKAKVVKDSSNRFRTWRYDCPYCSTVGWFPKHSRAFASAWGHMSTYHSWSRYIDD